MTADKTPTEKLAALRQKLAERFNEEGLCTLCFDLGIRYDDLPAQGTANKAREWVDYVKPTRRSQRG